jgi:hypothetical protein
MVQFVEDLTGTMVNADWLDAIVVAMNILKEETEYVEHYCCYHHHHQQQWWQQQNNCHYRNAEWVVVTVTFLTSFWKVLGLNLNLDTDCLD